MLYNEIRKRGGATKRHQVYLEALALANAPTTPLGTVCATEKHYTSGRHPVPYRMGFCHRWGEPDEHWHAEYRDYVGCSL